MLKASSSLHHKRVLASWSYCAWCVLAVPSRLHDIHLETRPGSAARGRLESWCRPLQQASLLRAFLNLWSVPRLTYCVPVSPRDQRFGGSGAGGRRQGQGVDLARIMRTRRSSFARRGLREGERRLCPFLFTYRMLEYRNSSRPSFLLFFD